MRRVEVVFCGNSVYLAGLAAYLQAEPELCITQVESPLEEALEELKMLRPDVVIFDCGALKPSRVVDLSRNYPGSRFIGLDLINGYLKIFSGKGARIANLNDLGRIIGEGWAGRE
jgi:DNA-binding NarL/FixJ family response regulator